MPTTRPIKKQVIVRYFSGTRCLGVRASLFISTNTAMMGRAISTATRTVCSGIMVNRWAPIQLPGREPASAASPIFQGMYCLRA